MLTLFTRGVKRLLSSGNYSFHPVGLELLNLILSSLSSCFEGIRYLGDFGTTDGQIQ